MTNTEQGGIVDGKREQSLQIIFFLKDVLIGHK